MLDTMRSFRSVAAMSWVLSIARAHSQPRTQNERPARENQQQIEKCAADPSSQSYFHVVPFASTPEPPEPGTTLDGFAACWFASQLEAAKEPSLWPARLGIETYRFTWLRTFDHPIVVRIESGPGGMKIVGKELDGSGGYGPGVVIRRTEKKLSQTEWSRLVDAIEGLGFWAKRPIEGKARGFDGAEWVIEGVRDGRYRIADLWSGDVLEGSDVRRACLALVSAAGIPIPGQQEIY